MKAQNLRSASWFDPSSYPFPSKTQIIGGHHMHYIDVGAGPVVLFVHGTPTWSYLFRQQIAALSRDFRCVAIDHIGFGLSDKPADAPYTPEWHSRNLEQFVDAMGLRDFTLVVHDFGGPIGLSMAIRRPELVNRIVLMNTFLWETANNPAAQKVDRLIRSALGRFLYLRMNASPKLLLKSAFADKRKLSKALHRHYTQVFPDKSSRYGLLRLAENLVGSSNWYSEQWAQMDRIADKPFCIVWGMKDQFISPEYLRIWEGKLRNVVAVHRLQDAGHFVAEEGGDSLTEAIRAMMRNSSVSSPAANRSDC